MKNSSPLQITALSKHFGMLKAVDDISFNIEEGEIHGFLGPNGAGKTTTIRCIMDFLRPESGEIKVFGTPVKANSKKLMPLIGYLPGEVDLFPNMTGKQLIDLNLKLRGLSKYPTTLIDAFNFDPGKKVKSYSTGNKQKLGIVLALMHSPKLIILDEPTTGLDPLLQHSFYNVLKECVKGGTTIFMSSHNLAEVEAICDRTTILRNGKVVATERIETLKQKRLYSARIVTKGKIDTAKLINKDVELVSEINNKLEFQVKHDALKFLSTLPMDKVADIEINHLGLEKIFIEYYKDETKKQ